MTNDSSFFHFFYCIAVTIIFHVYFSKKFSLKQKDNRIKKNTFQNVFIRTNPRFVLSTSGDNAFSCTHCAVVKMHSMFCTDANINTLICKKKGTEMTSYRIKNLLYIPLLNTNNCYDYANPFAS